MARSSHVDFTSWSTIILSGKRWWSSNIRLQDLKVSSQSQAGERWQTQATPNPWPPSRPHPSASPSNCIMCWSARWSPYLWMAPSWSRKVLGTGKVFNPGAKSILENSVRESSSSEWQTLGSPLHNLWLDTLFITSKIGWACIAKVKLTSITLQNRCSYLIK
jgi:hypothetical protein